MLLGIIADTHDNLGAIDAALEIFRDQGVELVIHAGDLISPFAAAKFSDYQGRFKAVFGNNDGERRGLSKVVQGFEGEINDFVEFEVGGRKIAVYHGTLAGVERSLVESGRYSVVVCGHSHTPEVKYVGETQLINPGEACGYLTGKKTLVLLDTLRMVAETLEF
ncbi:phosphodiesterase [archaeon BMS3Abin16]|nr:phosphodiesterase [archaeon BMS3Abin16]